LLDPPIEVRPSLNQVDDLMNEIQKTIDANERVLVTTLTKRMAEELHKYLERMNVKCRYIHSEVNTLERINILAQLREGEIDVLIGTQMLSKGLDFDNVSLVGILDADHLLNRPDFRAYERGFQLMTQVAGRAGRKNKRGKVVIQTKQPDHWVLQLVSSHDTLQFIKNELIERKNFNYPPFTKLIIITLKHADENLLNRASQDLAMHLKSALKERVLGPEFPIVKRIQNQYQKEIKIKYEKSLSDKKIKEHLMALLTNFYEMVSYKAIKVNIDVDAY
jgi:primosomal protein N' (replication factor Y)